jgi:hypothetical protein
MAANEIDDRVVTRKDIANLYSHLQTMMDSVPKSPTDSERFSLPVTPTNSFPLKSKSTPLVPSRLDPDCPCHHILVSKDSTCCALCDDVIPILAELHEEQEKRVKELKTYQIALEVKEQRVQGLEDQINNMSLKSIALDQKLNTATEKYQSLEKDMTILDKKYKESQEEAVKSRQEKKDVENELEELSQKLFEEANSMVADEKRAKYELEQKYKHLEEVLHSVREQMEAEGEQLKELRVKMTNMSTENLSLDAESLDRTSVSSEGRASRDMAGLFTREEEHSETTDPNILDDFKEFAQKDDAIPIRKLHTISYMKNSLVEDIEPCLRFGTNSRLSAKKLCEAILLNACFIEEAPSGFSQEQAKRPFDVPLKISAAKNMIWERLSSTPGPPFAGCQACGRSDATTKNLPYRFRISILDDWACIDRHCRDRLVAVCEFYMFVRNLRQGYYSSRTLPDLYNESIRLKLQMFYAR